MTNKNFVNITDMPAYVVLPRYQPNTFTTLIDAIRYAHADDSRNCGRGNDIYIQHPSGNLTRLSDEEYNCYNQTLLNEYNQRKEIARQSGIDLNGY